MGTPATPDTVVLIHGLWMTPRSWEHWIERYEARGLRVLAPGWPGLEVEVEELRADPTPLAKLDAARIVDHLDGIVRGLDRPPIIMGHSFGGAFTLLLLDRGLGAAGVAVDAASVRGIRDLPLSTLRSCAHVLANPFNRGKAVPFSAKRFRYAFGNTLSEEASNAAHERNPSWYFNLKANPEVMLTLRGGHQGDYRAEEVPQGAERERLWAVACEMYPGFADYQTRADRLIPLIHCTPLVR